MATESIFFGQNIAYSILGSPEDASSRLNGRISYDWVVRLLAVFCVGSVTLLHAWQPKAGIIVQDGISVMKILLLGIVIVCGIVAAAGWTRVPPSGNFVDPFQGTTTSASSFTSALFSASYAFDGI